MWSLVIMVYDYNLGMHDTTRQNTIIIKYRWLKKLPTYTDSVMSEIWLLSSTIKYKDENTFISRIHVYGSAQAAAP